MHARITQYRIRAGKEAEFHRFIESMQPRMRQQKGFRGLVVLRGGDNHPAEETIIAIWNSLDDMRAVEKNMLLTQALARAIPLCDGFPAIREQEVLMTEFSAK